MSFTTPKNEKENNIELDNINHLNNINNNISESEKKLNFFEMNLKFRNKISIDYTDYDFQKGEHSPKFLFRKRKIENLDNFKLANNTKENDKPNTNNISNRNTINNIEEPSIFFALFAF